MRALKKQKKEDPQYDLGLKEPFFNRFFKLKTRFDRFFAILETKRFFKNSFVWFLISILIIVNLLIFNYFDYMLDSLPSEIPLLQHSLTLSGRLVEAVSLEYIPYVTAVFTLFGVILSNRIYNKKEYLSIIVLITQVLSVSMLFYNILTITARYL